MTHNSLRRAVLDALDDSHERYDGDTPDHIIVSERDYAALSAEQLADSRYEGVATSSGEGYIGMHLWHSPALDARGKRALLLSDEAFRAIFDTPKDF